MYNSKNGSSIMHVYSHIVIYIHVPMAMATVTVVISSINDSSSRCTYSLGSSGLFCSVVVIVSDILSEVVHTLVVVVLSGTSLLMNNHAFPKDSFNCNLETHTLYRSIAWFPLYFACILVPAEFFEWLLCI